MQARPTLPLPPVTITRAIVCLNDQLSSVCIFALTPIPLLTRDGYSRYLSMRFKPRYFPGEVSL